MCELIFFIEDFYWGMKYILKGIKYNIYNIFLLVNIYIWKYLLFFFLFIIGANMIGYLR